MPRILALTAYDQFKDPIRSVGTFSVPVRVASGLERTITVKVVDEVYSCRCGGGRADRR